MSKSTDAGTSAGIGSARPLKGNGFRNLIAGRVLVVLDIETTTVPAGNEQTPEGQAGPEHREAGTYPISIGAVVLLNGTRRKTFHQLINPGVPVDEASSQYNGITTADLAAAPDTATVLREFDSFLAEQPEAYLVCHNAAFDVPHLFRAYQRAGMTAFARPVIDTQFLPSRLGMPGIGSRPKLTMLAERYQVITTVRGVLPERQRLVKALTDAQNTAEVLTWLLAEAAAQGVVEFPDFLNHAKPKPSKDIATRSSRHRRRFKAATIPAQHVAGTHHQGGLPDEPTLVEQDTWAQQITECVRLRCPHSREKVTVEAHRHTTEIRAGLADRLTALLGTVQGPGSVGTLLGALTPLLEGLNRPAARAWWRTNNRTLKAAARCQSEAGCPDCVAGHPCPQDTIHLLLTRRALDYGVTRTGAPVSLFSRQAKDDLWDRGNARKMDTWPHLGMHEMAAHMMWMLIEEANTKNNPTRRLDILSKAIERDLHHHDPRLALEVAKHWARQPERQDAVITLVEAMRAQATTDPGYLELDIWFDGPHQRQRTAVKAAAARQARPAAAGKRATASIERRPPHLRHSYRYQLYPTAPP